MKEEYLREVIRKEQRPISNFFLHSKAVVLNHQPPVSKNTFPLLPFKRQRFFQAMFPPKLELAETKKINVESPPVEYF